MKALILNGSFEEDEKLKIINKLSEEILSSQGYEVESVMLCEKKIGECTGCFGCWVKTPGICLIDDYGRTLTKNIINSDTVIWLTPVVFGGYSSQMKKALDRVIPLLLPFFKKVQGEIHHKERYARYPEVVVIGTMTEDDEEMKDVFNSLIKRNSLNWYNSFSGGIIQDSNEKDVENQLKKLLKSGEVGIC